MQLSHLLAQHAAADPGLRGPAAARLVRPPHRAGAGVLPRDAHERQRQLVRLSLVLGTGDEPLDRQWP